MVDGDLGRKRKGFTLQEWGIEISTFATKITDKATRDESRWVRVKQERLSTFQKREEYKGEVQVYFGTCIIYARGN